MIVAYQGPEGIMHTLMQLLDHCLDFYTFGQHSSLLCLQVQVQYSTVQYSTVQYSTVQFSSEFFLTQFT